LKSNYYKLKIFLLLLCLSFTTKAQGWQYEKNNLAFTGGLHLAVGTHIQRIGCFVQVTYVQDHLQANAVVRGQFNRRAIGPGGRSADLILSPGIVYAFGDKRLYGNSFYTTLSNQTAYRSSIAYAYNAYFSTNKTSQQTGQVGFQYGELKLIAENDLLARPALDRFRTGAFLLEYTYQNLWQAGMSTLMWTGQMGRRQSIDPAYMAGGCYMDTSSARYADVSAGLLSAQFRWNTGAAQVLQANAGIDAEQIRNAIQNHFFHDLRFLPKKLRPKNCHLPMLASDGRQYLYQEGQKIRPAKPLLNLSTNSALFY
jgi:hypothetical protein